MKNMIVTYETQHGSAKKIAQTISKELGCKYINIDTPFEAEDLSAIDTVITVFNFRGPYTAQLTKLYLERVKDQLQDKNLVVIGEGIFSEKEFPVVADEIAKIAPSRTFQKYFVPGQLRTDILFPEEKVLLKKFGEMTGMTIEDMGELDLSKAEEVAKQIKHELSDQPKNSTKSSSESKNDKDKNNTTETKWKCLLCGYVHAGPNPPDKCPICGASADKFTKI